MRLSRARRTAKNSKLAGQQIGKSTTDTAAICAYDNSGVHSHAGNP